MTNVHLDREQFDLDHVRPNSQQIVQPQVPQTGYNQLPQGQQITQMPQSGQYQSQQQQQPPQQNCWEL
jgi:hypothetical protein